MKEISAGEVKYSHKGDPTGQILEAGHINREGPVRRFTTLLGISKCKTEGVESGRGEEEIGVCKYTVPLQEWCPTEYRVCHQKAVACNFLQMMLQSDAGADTKGASKTMRNGWLFERWIWFLTENMVLRNGMPRPGNWTTISDQYAGNILQALAMAWQLCIRVLRCFLHSNINAALSSMTVLKILSTSKNTSTGSTEPLLEIDVGIRTPYGLRF
jgi:hypothetical protein